MFTYRDEIKLPEETTLGTLSTVHDLINGMGRVIKVDLPDRVIWFQIDTDDENEEDLWDLAIRLSDLGDELAAYGIGFEPDRDKVQEE